MIPITTECPTEPHPVKTTVLYHVLVDFHFFYPSASDIWPAFLRKGIDNLKKIQFQSGGIIDKLHTNLANDDLVMDEIYEAQRLFMACVDKFLHGAPINIGFQYNPYQDMRNLDTVKAMIRFYPAVLATQDEYGWLPIHYASEESVFADFYIDQKEVFLPLLASVGMEYAVGGAESRGGLLIDIPSRYENEETGKEIGTFYFPRQNTLQYLVRQKGDMTRVFEALRNVESGLLFLKEDVCGYDLIFHIIDNLFEGVSFDTRMNTLKYMVEFDPDSLFHTVYLSGSSELNNDSLFHTAHHNSGLNSYNPLSWIVARIWSHCDDGSHFHVVEYVLGKAIHKRPLCPTIGGLFHEISKDRFVLTMLIKNLNEDEVLDCIKRVLSTASEENPILPIMLLQQTIRCTPQFIDEVCMVFPDSLNVRDKDNRLPIHVALDAGIEWSEDFMKANHIHFQEVDPVTSLPLLALAVNEPSCDLTTIYYLLRKNPDYVNCTRKENLEKEEISQSTATFTNKNRKRKCE